MQYCNKCKTGALRQLEEFCYKCGERLVNKPASDCKCGEVPMAHHTFCIKCGNQLEIKIT